MFGQTVLNGILGFDSGFVEGLRMASDAGEWFWLTLGIEFC